MQQRISSQPGRQPGTASGDQSAAPVPGRSTLGSAAAPGRAPAGPAAPAPLQLKRLADVASGGAPPEAPAGTGEPLPTAVQTQMSAALGADFTAVRVHRDNSAAALGAAAYARGNDVFFAPGQYDPHSRAGQELIGHELTHVVQQRAGRVAAPQAKGAPINADPELEAEADECGKRAAAGERVGVPGAHAASSAPRPAVQCKKLSTVVSDRSTAQQMHSPRWGLYYLIQSESSSKVHISIHPIPAQKARYDFDKSVPAWTDIEFTEFHVTINDSEHYFFGDAGTLLDHPHRGTQAAWTAENWTPAIAAAAAFLGRLDYLTNQLTDALAAKRTPATPAPTTPPALPESTFTSYDTSGDSGGPPAPPRRQSSSTTASDEASRRRVQSAMRASWSSSRSSSSTLSRTTTTPTTTTPTTTTPTSRPKKRKQPESTSSSSSTPAPATSTTTTVASSPGGLYDGLAPASDTPEKERET